MYCTKVIVKSFVIILGLLALNIGECNQNEVEGRKYYVDSLISRYGEIQTSEIVFVSSEMLFHRRLDESDLPEIGCTFASSDKTKINQLVEILHLISTTQTEKVREIDPRMNVKLVFENGKIYSFVIERIYAEEMVVLGFSGNLPIWAPISIYSQVREWAKELEPVKNMGRCDIKKLDADK